MRFGGPKYWNLWCRLRFVANATLQARNCLGKICEDGSQQGDFEYINIFCCFSIWIWFNRNAQDFETSQNQTNQTHHNSVISPKVRSSSNKYMRIIRNSKTLKHDIWFTKTFFKNRARTSFGDRAKVLETGLTFFLTFFISSENATIFGVQSDIMIFNSGLGIIWSRKKCSKVFLGHQKYLKV